MKKPTHKIINLKEYVEEKTDKQITACGLNNWTSSFTFSHFWKYVTCKECKAVK